MKRLMLLAASALLCVGCGFSVATPDKQDIFDSTRERFVAEIALQTAGKAVTPAPVDPAPKPDGKRTKCDGCVDGKVGDGRTMIDCMKCGGDGWIDPTDNAESLLNQTADRVKTLSLHWAREQDGVSKEVAEMRQEMKEMEERLSSRVEPIPDPWTEVPEEFVDGLVDLVIERMQARAVEPKEQPKPAEEKPATEPPKTSDTEAEKTHRDIVVLVNSNNPQGAKWIAEVAPKAEQLGYKVSQQEAKGNDAETLTFRVCGWWGCCVVRGYITFEDLQLLDTHGPQKFNEMRKNSTHPPRSASIIPRGRYVDRDGYRSRWKYPGDIAEHLASVHGVIAPPSESKESLERFHDDLHDAMRSGSISGNLAVSR